MKATMSRFHQEMKDLTDLGERLHKQFPDYQRDYRKVPYVRKGFSVEEFVLLTNGTTGWKEVFWSASERLADNALRMRIASL